MNLVRFSTLCAKSAVWLLQLQVLPASSTLQFVKKEMCRGKQSIWYLSVLQNSLDEFCYAYVFMSKPQRPIKFHTYRIYYAINLY